MSYETPRNAKLKLPLQAKVIGKGVMVEYGAGKACQVQRNPSKPGWFIVYFRKDHIGQVPAEQLPETIQYTDGREQY